MAQGEVAELLHRIGETAMAWRGARSEAEAERLVATYHGLLRELGARGLDADALDLMDMLPDVLMPHGWRTEEPPAPPAMSREDDWRSAQLWDAYDAAVRRAGVAPRVPAHR